MGNRNRLILFLQIFYTISKESTATVNAQGKSTENTPDSVFVVYDPNVSILDKPNLLRYNSTEQIPLVSKVATKFKRMFIQLTEVDMEYDLQTSLSQSAMAIAEYNKLSSSKEKIEVWLAYNTNLLDYRFEDDFIYHKEPQRIIVRLHSIANQSNAIYNGTVTTILLPYKLLVNQVNQLTSDNATLHHNNFMLPGLQRGILFETDIAYTYSNIKETISKLGLDEIMMILIMRPIIIVEQIQDSNNRIDELQRRMEGTNGTFWGSLVTTHDTDSTGKMNLTNLVSIWESSKKWADKNGNILILSKAFDTPKGDSVESKTGGWWRLVEDPTYSSPKDYKFEEKALVAKASDEKSETSLEWLKENTKFSKDHVQITFSMFDLGRVKNIQTYSDIEITSLLKNVVEKFNEFVIILHDDTEKGLRVIIYELQFLNLTMDNVKINLVVLPKFELNRAFKYEISLKGIYQLFPSYSSIMDRIKNYIVPFEEDGKENKYRSFMKDVDPSKYNFGFSFNASNCSKMNLDKNWEQKSAIMRQNNVSSIIFFFEENDATVKLGVTRMIKQRIVTMEHCKKLVGKWGLAQKVKVSFMMLHYPTSTEFYFNKWEMINFIEYWQKLSTWAKNTGSSVIMSGVMDCHRYFKTRDKHETELGWWRMRDAVERLADSNNNVWIDKVDDAMLRFSGSSTNSLSTTQIVLITTSSLVVVAAIIVAVVMRRKYAKPELITTEEINCFHQGMIISQSELGTADALYKLPYEKRQYEVPKDSFTIDVNATLGSGEFGLVCAGEILVQKEFRKVATKMINPYNFKKSALKGLLSEIKVLAYVGKHDNITELLGANTQDLKFGKVYIFLELCELGSMEKYLRKMKTTLQEEKEDESKTSENNYSILDARTNKNPELIAMERMSLEPSDKQDLLGWSHEICMGMAYLASKHVVHADLAARNVLLNEHKHAKICDFGLSRRMYNYTNYVKEQQEPLPWKWMSPESLKISEFSEKSDVWAYGITLWEIFSLGEQPYAGLPWSLNFADMLEEGFRLEKPKYDVSNMYSIMKDCWSTVSKNRPTFAELLVMFD